MPPVTWLYVPGDRPDRFAKAAAAGADVVIVDLEDAVASANKLRARRELLSWLPDAAPGTVEVRVNAPGTAWFGDDLAGLGGQVALSGVRVPKVQSPTDVAQVVASTRLPVTAVLETGLGVQNAFAVASATGVAAVTLGEADLSADLGLDDEDGLAWSRSRLVVAARAAGLPAPAQSVYPDVRDLDGLRASCLRGRALGLRGRAAVHPRQLPVIRAAFRPSEREVLRAQQTLAELDRLGDGVGTLPDGTMVDAAMRRRAQDVLDRAAAG